MRKPKYNNTTVYIESNNDIFEGKSLEREIEQQMTTKQPIIADAPMIYTSRKEGVIPAYDIRTDRFDRAQDAMDELAKSYRARREEALKPQSNETTTTEANEL